jgi:hypothetical protein
VRGAKRAPSRQVLPGRWNCQCPYSKGILATAAVIEIALSAQPMAGKTWRRGKDWRYDTGAAATGARRPRHPHRISGAACGYRLAREPSDISVENILRVSAARRTIPMRSLRPIGRC